MTPATSYDDLPPGITDQTRYYTNAYIVRDGRILLGRKKRGIGLNYYNGFGGKVEVGESSVQAARRELEEEAGITAPLVQVGTLLFTKEGIEWTFHINIYRAEEYEGEIVETEEMRPEWFPIDQIPYGQMWGSDKYWLPLVLSKKPFIGRTDFDADNNLKKWWFGHEYDGGVVSA
ncbi:Oxidized purine nucleoside triphosphate hydrolase [Pleurotus pulmonarius]